jgi:hypothetical protein
LQFRVGGDHDPPAGDEFAAGGREGVPPGRVQGMSHRFQRGGSLRRRGYRIGDYPGHRAVAEEHFPLVGEVPEESALSQPRALRDVDDRRVVVAPLREQLKGG